MRHWTGAENDLLSSLLENSTFLFDWSYSIGAMDVKMDGCVFEKNRLSRCWQCHIQMFFGCTV